MSAGKAAAGASIGGTADAAPAAALLPAAAGPSPGKPFGRQRLAKSLAGGTPEELQEMLHALNLRVAEINLEMATLEELGKDNLGELQQNTLSWQQCLRALRCIQVFAKHTQGSARCIEVMSPSCSVGTLWGWC
jgi:hypothetical protein